VAWEEVWAGWDSKRRSCLCAFQRFILHTHGSQVCSLVKAIFSAPYSHVVFLWHGKSDNCTICKSAVIEGRYNVQLGTTLHLFLWIQGASRMHLSHQRLFGIKAFCTARELFQSRHDRLEGPTKLVSATLLLPLFSRTFIVTCMVSKDYVPSTLTWHVIGPVLSA
jgi:hypothetical protein